MNACMPLLSFSSENWSQTFRVVSAYAVAALSASMLLAIIEINVRLCIVSSLCTLPVGLISHITYVNVDIFGKQMCQR